MRLSFWSDEDRWFVPRTFGLGYSLNLKYAAKRIGWIRSGEQESPEPDAEHDELPVGRPKTREQRLRERIASSKYEDRG